MHKQISDDLLNEMELSQQSYNISIPYQCTVESLYQHKFHRILELDNIEFNEVIESLDVVKNKMKVF